MRQIAYLIVILLFLPTFIGAEDLPDPVFYRNAGVEIEFRILLEDQENIPWILLQDHDGMPQRASKEIVISNEDIVGFTTYDFEPLFEDDKGFIMHFNPDSWRKIREVTGRLKNKRIALVRDGIIFWSPTMHEALTRSAVIEVGGEETSVAELLKDLPTEKFPERLGSKTLYEQFIFDWMEIHPDDLDIKNSLRDLNTPKIYEKFLVSWVESHPEDWKTMYELVSYYFEEKDQHDINKALPFAKKLVKLRPEDSQMRDRLIQCYLLMSNNEKALATGIQALPHTPKSEKMFLHRMIGEIQFKMGHKKEALESIEASLESMKQTEFTTPHKSLAKITGVVLPKKEEMIQETVDRIDFIMAH